MDKLNPPSNLVQFKTASQLNAMQSRDDLHKLERLEAASEAAIKTFEACVDFGKADTTALLATAMDTASSALVSSRPVRRKPSCCASLTLRRVNTVP